MLISVFFSHDFFMKCFECYIVYYSLFCLKSLDGMLMKNMKKLEVKEMKTL
jgi:hypothetical protein